MKVFRTGDVLTIKYKSSWQNNIGTYQELIKTYSLISQSDAKIVYLQMEKVEFIAANLFAVLGGMFYELCKVQKRRIGFHSLRDKIKTVMQKNAFGSFFHLEKWRINIIQR